MLIVIPTVMTKKKLTKSIWKRNWEQCQNGTQQKLKQTQKNSATQEIGTKNCKMYKTQIAKWQKSFLIRNHFKYKWLKYSG